MEQAGIKRKGERRDHTGGGARTYKAWVSSLGLIFTQKSTGKIKLTLAGEAIMSGDSPVEVLKNQILKYQFPSAFSLGRGVKVAPRFKIRPFRFLLKLLNDKEIEYLTEEEIAKIIVTKAENETDKCYKYIVNEILEFRQRGDIIYEEDYFDKYKPSKGEVNPSHPFSHLMDLANTIVNWLEYTQLVKRHSGQVRILDDKRLEVQKILSKSLPFIDRPEEYEYFQRKYGLDPKHKKDTRNLTEARVITVKIIAEQKIKQAYIAESLKHPITKITTNLVDKIVEQTGFNDKLVEEVLLKLYPSGSIGGFMTAYFEMAFKGRDKATDFEKATVELFKNVFGFETKHVGPIGLTPDVLILSNSDGYQAIIDNKAYSKYTVSNDHRNRMIYNYIKNLKNYSNFSVPLSFFSYIAGGFGNNINSQIMDIVNATNIAGSAMSVSNMIKLVELYESKNYTHKNIKDIFSVNRQILLSDL
ncbi:hypothetical protein J2Z53_000682 [Clostridium moniliforme]|uniref:Restriction endonuclease n=1 Tax=Clostridium moniliforme TaxID=39489 RepID=A0ABS4EYM5_9CLOT|nr:restriction endonuclease FokI C-terminal domain-containing protein [Clostridium moniliforme]MBP1889103.1 hypothetical protein [Clostridium moniliforme]